MSVKTNPVSCLLTGFVFFLELVFENLTNALMSQDKIRLTCKNLCLGF